MIPYRYEVRHHDDALDAKLSCNDCWDDSADADHNLGYICDIEDGDSVRVLVSCIEAHEDLYHTALTDDENGVTD